MNFIRKTFVVSLLLYSGICNVFAQFNTAGSVNYQNLLLPYNARSAALGGSGCALPGAVDMVTIHPAAPASVDGNQAAISYMNLGLGMWGSALSYSHKLKFGTVVLSLQGMSAGEIEVIEVFNSSPVYTDRHALDQYVVPSISVARKLLDGKVLLGATAKGMYHRIDDSKNIHSFKAVGFDLGVQYRQFNNRFTAAAVIRNLGTEIQATSDTQYPTPFIFETGISYVPRYIPEMRLVADVNKSRGADFMYEPGLEFTAYPDVFQVRIGFPFSQSDLEEQLRSFGGDKNEDYIKSNINMFACGAGIKTEVSNTDVEIDISAQFKDESYPVTITLGALVTF